MNKKLFFVPFLVTVVSNSIQTEDKFNPVAYDRIEFALITKNVQHEEDEKGAWIEGQMNNLIEQIKSTDGVTGKAYGYESGDECDGRTIAVLIQRTGECDTQDWEVLCKNVKNFEETLNSENSQEETIANLRVRFLRADEEEAQK